MSCKGGCQTLKIVFLGDSGVGKSCVINQFCDQRFDPLYKATIGMDFRQTCVEVPSASGKGVQPVQVALWDTAGQERFHALGTAYYRGADACVLVFDLNAPPTFHHITSWLEEFYMHTDNRTCILLGNKRDLLSETTSETTSTAAGLVGGSRSGDGGMVRRGAGGPASSSPSSSLSSLAEAWCAVQNKNRTALMGDIHYYEVSAKDGTDISTALLSLLSMLVTSHSKEKNFVSLTSDDATTLHPVADSTAADTTTTSESANTMGSKIPCSSSMGFTQASATTTTTREDGAAPVHPQEQLPASHTCQRNLTAGSGTRNINSTARGRVRLEDAAGGATEPSSSTSSCFCG